MTIRVPRVVKISVVTGAVLGALAGYAALSARGAVELGAIRLEGIAGILAVSGILALMGLMLGLILVLIMQTLKSAANGGSE